MSQYLTVILAVLMHTSVTIAIFVKFLNRLNLYPSRFHAILIKFFL